MPCSAASARIEGRRAPGAASRELIQDFTANTICSVSGTPVDGSSMSFMRGGGGNCQQNY